MLNTDLQKLEPGNRVRLVEVDGTKFGADILRFHSDTLPIRRKNWPLLAGRNETTSKIYMVAGQGVRAVAVFR